MENRPESVICFHCGAPQGSGEADLPECPACRARLLDDLPAPFLSQAPIYRGDFKRHLAGAPQPAAVADPGAVFEDDPEPA